MQKKKCITQIKNNVKKSKQCDDLISIVLFCDFPGYRMKSYGLTCMIDIDENNKLIDYHIASIQEYFKNYEIIICTGFDSEKICKHITQKYYKKNIRIVENPNFEKTGPCESMRLALNNINNNRILIMDGNLIFEHQIFESFNTSTSSIFLTEENINGLEVCANINENGYVEHFSYGGQKPWSEIIFLHGKPVVETLRKIVNNKECKRKLVFEAFNEILKYSHKIKCEIKKSNIKKINNIKTYHTMRKNNEIFNR